MALVSTTSELDLSVSGSVDSVVRLSSTSASSLISRRGDLVGEGSLLCSRL